MRRLLAILIWVQFGHAEDLPSITLGLRAPVVSLNPFTVDDVEISDWIANALEPLARFDLRTRDFEPVLATSWRREKNLLYVTLRENVRFHDGQILSAEDVRFTLDAFRDPANRASLSRARWDDVRTIRVRDPLHFEVLFKDLTYGALTDFLSLRVLPRSFYAESDPARFRDNIVGTGPFRQDGDGFKPHEDWWNSSKPGFKLRRRLVRDATLAKELLLRGQLDVFALAAGEADASSQHLHSGFGEGIWLNLNWRKPELREAGVRRALLHLWNRVGLRDKIFGSRWTVSATTFSGAQSRPEPFDPPRARRELKQAGYDEGHPLRLKLLIAQPSAERWATLFQTDVRAAGVRIDIERAPTDVELWRRLGQGKFDLVTGGGGLSDLPARATWSRRGAFNFMGFADEHVERYLTRLDHEFAVEARSRLVRDLVGRLTEVNAQLAGLRAEGSEWFISKALRLDSDTPQFAWRWRRQ